jgi:DNA-binding SARP family transcriptional activator
MMLMHTNEPLRSHLSALDADSGTLVCLLGSFRVLRLGQPSDELIAGKAISFLAALALHLENGVPREELLEMLWPEREIKHAAVLLNSLVYSLHRRLCRARQQADLVVFANGWYALNKAAGVSTDVARFDRIVAEGDRLAVAQHDATAANHYERALTLYRGDLVVGTDIYSVIERERLRSRFLTILAWLAERGYCQADYAAALNHALRMLAHDPCREDAHRIVMRAQVHQGARAQALRQYRLCEQVLRREFDAAPEAATTMLFDRIRHDPSSV